MQDNLLECITIVPYASKDKVCRRIKRDESLSHFFEYWQLQLLYYHLINGLFPNNQVG